MTEGPSHLKQGDKIANKQREFAKETPAADRVSLKYPIKLISIPLGMSFHA